LKFNLTIIRPQGFKHSSGFHEVADSLAWALSALGHEANVLPNWIDTNEDCTNIVFGSELLAPTVRLPRNCIIYNLEQPTHPNMAKVRELAKGLRVWDYNLTNVKQWQTDGYNVKHVPVGYTPNLTRIPKAENQDIDVLFFGWMTPRRQKVIDDLRAAGLKVVAVEGCYGGGRDNLIARAKIVLNVHHDGRELFEIVRVSYLLANSKCVLSELSPNREEYQDIEMGFPEFMGDPTKLVLGLLSDEKTRQGYETAGFDAIRKKDYVESVRAALVDSLSPQERVAFRYKAGCDDGDMKDFLPWIKEHAKGTVLEIGVRNGASTSAFLSGVEENGGVVLSVDLADCSSIFAGHPQWKFIQSDSQNPKLHVPEIDVLLIDGDHTREGYKKDLEKFYPLVKPGGIILSHDVDPLPGNTYEDNPETVTSVCTVFGEQFAVQEQRPSVGIREEYFRFAEEHELEHLELPGKHGMGVLFKK